MFDYASQRYIHLDFHTPGFVDVGKKFNAREFGDTLEKAKVNSIAVFALCHHGYTYYPSKIGVTHPRMKIDLLGLMTEELKKRGIQCVIYFSQNVNETLSGAHPEFVACNKDGSPVNSQILLSGDELYWRWLCPNRENWIETYLLPLVKESLSAYHADGIFIDMAGYLPGSCFCSACRGKMSAAGLDINNPDQHSDFLVRTNQEVAKKLRSLLNTIRPDMRFLEGAFNRMGDAHNAKGVLSEFYLETLPVQVGWFMFPFLSRYFRNIGLPVMGLTGRFLNNWGDFGTLKTAHQLKVELATHLAAGLPSGVGDHMHFCGRLDKPVYKVIGEAFSFLETRQPLCVGGEPLTEIAVPVPKRLSAIAATLARAGNAPYNPMTAVTGLTKMLTELHFQWDVSSDQSVYNKCGAVILNHNTCEMEDVEALITFVTNGGLLIACHEGLNAKTPEATVRLQQFLGLNEVTLLSDPGVYYAPALPKLKKNIPAMPVYTHSRSYALRGDPETETAAVLLKSPCIRSRDTFYGHFHGAPAKRHGPAVTIIRRGKGTAAAIGPSLFYSYMKSGNVHHAVLINNILSQYFPGDRRKIKTNAPGVVELALSKKSDCVILQAVPFIASRRHSESFETLNDTVALHGVKVSLQVPGGVKGVTDAVSKKNIKFTFKDGWVSFGLPPFKEHFVAHVRI